MNGHSSPTTRRFVRAAWFLLAFQLVAAMGATGLAIWAASRVQQVIDDRDAMALRLRELEARPLAPAESRTVQETEAPAESVAKPVPTPRPTVRPPVRPGPDAVTRLPEGPYPPPPPPPPPPPVRREAELIGRNLQPPYPAVEERAQRGGIVRLRVTIGANGRVTAVERQQATSDAFWRATERHALNRWRFRPATLDGRPIESTRVMTVTFRIEDI